MNEKERKRNWHNPAGKFIPKYTVLRDVDLWTGDGRPNSYPVGDKESFLEKRKAGPSNRAIPVTWFGGSEPAHIAKH